jgi:predicted CoA-binding protein
MQNPVLVQSGEALLLTESEIESIVRDARVIAVVGMQDEAHGDKAAFQIPAMLKKRGYRVIPVNPLIQSSLGEVSLTSVSELTDAPDILDVFRRIDAIPALTEEILSLPPEKRPKTVWLQSGITHPASEAKLAAAGFQVVSDRCLGVYAARVGR